MTTLDTCRDVSRMKTNIKRSIIATIAWSAFAIASVAQNAGTETTGAAGTGTTGTGTAGAEAQANREALFRTLDTNGDGSISHDEFSRGGAAALNTYQGSGSGTTGTGTGGTGTSGTGTSGTGTSGTGTSGTGTSGTEGASR